MPVKISFFLTSLRDQAKQSRKHSRHKQVLSQQGRCIANLSLDWQCLQAICVWFIGDHAIHARLQADSGEHSGNWASRGAELEGMVQADKAKLLAVRQAEEAQAAAAQAAADQQRQEAEAAERKAEDASMLMSLKRSRLPAEPAASDPTAITVAVRAPSGTRISRRSVLPSGMPNVPQFNGTGLCLQLSDCSPDDLLASESLSSANLSICPCPGCIDSWRYNGISNSQEHKPDKLVLRKLLLVKLMISILVWKVFALQPRSGK